MKKKFMVVGFLILLLSLTVGFANAYDQKRPDGDPIQTKFEDEFSYLRIVAQGTAIGLVMDKNKTYRLKEGFWKQTGSCTVVAAGYVLTAAHVVSPDIIALPESECASRITDVIAMTSRTILLYDYKNDPIIATVLYENPTFDLALLTYNHKKNPWLKPIPYPVEYKQQPLAAGDIVCAVLHERDEKGRLLYGVRLEWGVILDPGPDPPDNYSIAWLNPFDITMDLNIMSGDSGSPLFVFSLGRPRLIGVVRAAHMEYPLFLAYAVQLPVVHKLINGRR